MVIQYRCVSNFAIRTAPVAVMADVRNRFLSDLARIILHLELSPVKKNQHQHPLVNLRYLLEMSCEHTLTPLDILFHTGKNVAIRHWLNRKHGKWQVICVCQAGASWGSNYRL